VIGVAYSGGYRPGDRLRCVGGGGGDGWTSMARETAGMPSRPGIRRRRPRWISSAGSSAGPTGSETLPGAPAESRLRRGMSGCPRQSSWNGSTKAGIGTDAGLWRVGGAPKFARVWQSLPSGTITGRGWRVSLLGGLQVTPRCLTSESGALTAYWTGGVGAPRARGDVRSSADYGRPPATVRGGRRYYLLVSVDTFRCVWTRCGNRGSAV
jgi:hypothetical protein